jgi:hypothetical protein
MTTTRLPGDSTVFSIEGPLDEEYVRRMLKSMWECQQELGNAQVRISLEASATPDYAIEALMDPDPEETTPWKSFSGRTHRPIGEAVQERTNWSSEPTPLPEIARLIGSIRSAKRR